MNEHISSYIDRSRAAKIQVANTGRFPSCVPIGYRNQTNEDGSKTIVVDPETSSLVTLALRLCRAHGLPIRQLLAIMTAKGLRSRNGKPLSVSAFWYLLSNPFYAGLIRWQGELIPGSHPPLISIEQHQDILKNLGAARRSPGRNGKTD